MVKVTGPFAVMGCLLLFYIFINSITTTKDNVDDVFAQHAELKNKENPPTYSKETILDIQFELEEKFLSDSKKVIVKTDVQTYVYVYSDFFTDFALTKGDTSYLQFETLRPDTDEEVTYETIFLSQDDLSTYSDAYAKEFGGTLRLKEIEEHN